MIPTLWKVLCNQSLFILLSYNKNRANCLGISGFGIGIEFCLCCSETSLGNTKGQGSMLRPVGADLTKYHKLVAYKQHLFLTVLETLR